MANQNYNEKLHNFPVLISWRDFGVILLHPALAFGFWPCKLRSGGL